MALQNIPPGLPKYPPSAPGILSQVVQIYEEDDFDCGGVASTGAAAIATNNTFGKLGWRCASSGGAAAATTLVTTGQSATERGVVQIDIGTGAGAGQGFQRAAVGVLPFTFAAGQYIEFKWKFQIPTLSTGAQSFFARLGYTSAIGTSPTDFVGFEINDAAPSSGNIIGRVIKASAAVNASGGSTVAAVAGQWHFGRAQWDGATLSYFVDDIYVGSNVAADVPTASIAEGVQGLRSAGATSRTILVGGFKQLRPPAA